VPEWAVTNLDQGLQAGPAGAAIQGLMRSLGYSILVWVPVAGGAVFVLAAAVSLAIMWLPGLWAHFGTLGLEQRLVSSQHALFVVVFGLQIVPYTALVTIYLFERWSADYFTGADDGLVSQVSMRALQPCNREPCATHTHFCHPVNCCLDCMHLCHQGGGERSGGWPAVCLSLRALERGPSGTA
jgi:hypothetical protein